MAKKEVLHYPLVRDDGWNVEVSRILPWLWGKRVDIGCGGRSIGKDDIRVDLDPELEPDFIASGDKLPFKNDEFNSLYAIHVIEHLQDTRGALKEFLRVLSGVGIIALVVPDRRYTGTEYKHKAEGEQSQFMVHLHEWTKDEFLSEIDTYIDLGFEVLDFGEALPNWSFYVVLKKNG